MEPRDIELARVLQKEEIFLTLDPYAKVAGILGWGVDEVLKGCRRLQEAGIIRRFGAALTPGNAGFKANAMVAWEVDADKAEETGRKMAAHPRISHCYIRRCFEGFPYNLYTMIHGNTPEDLYGIIEGLSAENRITSYRALRSVKEFKKSSPFYYPKELEQAAPLESKCSKKS